MARMWEAENIPISHINDGQVLLNTILESSDLNNREVEIVANTLQWLGTYIGREFL